MNLKLVNTISLAASGAMPGGLTFDGRSIWVGDVFSPYIYQLDMDGVLIKLLSVDGVGTFNGPVQLIGNQLYCVSFDDVKMHVVDLKGRLIRSISLAAFSAGAISIWFNGKNFHVIDYLASELMICNADMTVIKSMGIPSGYEVVYIADYGPDGYWILDAGGSRIAQFSRSSVVIDNISTSGIISDATCMYKSGRMIIIGSWISSVIAVCALS